MDALELRIGNWVNQGEYYGDRQIVAYEVYNFDLFKRGSTNVAEYYKYWQPIPINKEWLLHFGFKATNDFGGIGWKKGNFLLLRVHKSVNDPDFYYECEWVPEIFPFSERGHVRSNIRYVHQLQNLYFALTGGELATKQAA